MRNNQRTSSEHLFKLLVIGEASTGKTSFIRRYVHQFYSKSYKATIGVDFALKTVELDDKTLIRLQLWDIAGQERFGQMTRAYYKDAAGAFIVFDAGQRKSFESVMRWKHDLDSKVSQADGSSIPCLLLANKCDLIQWTEEDEALLREFAKQNGFIGCLYTSPKEDVNIEQAGFLLIREIVKNRKSLQKRVTSTDNDAILMADQLNRRSRACFGSKTSCCL